MSKKVIKVVEIGAEKALTAFVDTFFLKGNKNIDIWLRGTKVFFREKELVSILISESVQEETIMSFIVSGEFSPHAINVTLPGTAKYIAIPIATCSCIAISYSNETEELFSFSSKDENNSTYVELIYKVLRMFLVIEESAI